MEFKKRAGHGIGSMREMAQKWHGRGLKALAHAGLQAVKGSLK